MRRLVPLRENALQIAGLIISFLLASCHSSAPHTEAEADSLNVLAYHLRYVCADSTLAMASRALEASAHYPAGRAFAQNNLAYVAYQQMRYDDCLAHLKQVFPSRNQVEMLCADVMAMKTAQRTGQGLLFFKHRTSAQQRMARIAEAERLLTPLQRARMVYARSEYHIISSTYYYYYHQQQQAIHEIEAAAATPALAGDTAQWLYYRYMLGSGGLVQGDSLSVALEEFDHLVATYTTARAACQVYFQANALQSLATLLDNPARAAHIEAQRPNAMVFLRNQSSPSSPSSPNSPSTPSTPISLPLVLQARDLFSVQHDLFQLACAHRTVGEIYFRHGQYPLALQQFTTALELVESQRSRSTLQVPFWTFSMREYLSLTYSALGNKAMADHHRNLYLDYIEQFSQDYEMEDRKLQLEHELRRTRISLASLVLLALLSALLLWRLLRRMHRQQALAQDGITHFTHTAAWKAFEKQVALSAEKLTDAQQEAQEQIAIAQDSLHRHRSQNLERRAKLAMVYAVVPYLDRLIAQVARMQERHQASPQDRQYAAQLAAEISRINNALTAWIQLSHGQLKLHVTTFPLDPLFHLIRSNQALFSRQGITLEVEDTPLCVKADAALTLFMINTLCDNARKFTPSGGRVSLTARTVHNAIEISVADTGKGLSPEDVHTICAQKIFDPNAIGRISPIAQSLPPLAHKGTGFGILNCKGIIAKYRKTSTRFAACAFGVESEEGKGSRFWFRLPAAMLLSLGLFCAKANALHPVCDSVSQLNIDARYAEAFQLGQQAIERQELQVDTPSLIHLYNEMAVAAMAQHQWVAYNRANQQCLLLHSLYTADTGLPAYCQQMQQMRSNNAIIYALLVLFGLLALALFYRLSLRGILRTDSHTLAVRQWMENALAQATDAAANGQSFQPDAMPAAANGQCFQPDDIPAAPQHEASVQAFCQALRTRFARLNAQQDHLETLCAQARKLQFETDRLYVMNQVIDNSLSTLKHETMYYPARAQQLIEGLESDEATGADLSQLLTFHRHIYMLLYQQAERQVEPAGYHPRQIPLHTLHSALPPVAVWADPFLLEMLFLQLAKVEAAKPELSAEHNGSFATIRAHWPGIAHSQNEIDEMFQPTAGRIPLLVMKQIIREMDAHSRHGRLRLEAQATAQGYAISFTLPTKA